MKMELKKHHKSTFDNIPDEKRIRILEAATNEFAKKGYYEASVSEIAKKSDISVGAVYKYFDSKQDLFLTIADYSIVRMENLLLGLAKADEDVLIKVEKILREIILASREQSLLIKLYNSMTAINDKALAERFATEMESMTSRIYIEAIKEGQRNGEIRADIDPAVAAFLIDNLFMTLQFSYAGDYYEERFKIFCGEDVHLRDEFIIEQILKFIKSALK